MELVKRRLKLFTVRIPSNNSPTSKHYSHLQYKYRPTVKILPLIVLIAIGFEAVTATYFVIGVSCDVMRFCFAYTTNVSMRYSTVFFREAAGLFKMLVIVKRKEFKFMANVIQIFVYFILYFWKKNLELPNEPHRYNFTCSNVRWIISSTRIRFSVTF